MNKNHDTVVTIDLKFMGRANAIAAYLIPHRQGAVLVECGPGSTTAALEDGLAANGFRTEDITDVLLTHIHLDHAGAAGWLATPGSAHPRPLRRRSAPARPGEAAVQR